MKYLLITIMLFLCLGHIFAQEEDQILVNELKQSTIITQPATLHKGFFRVGGAYTYSVGDKIFTNAGNKEFVPENTWVKAVNYTILLQYGITDRIEFYAQLPYSARAMFYSSVMSIPLLKTKETTLFDIHGKGFGDLITGFYFQLLEGSKTKPSIVAGLFAELPIGEKNPTNIKDDFSFDLPMSSGEPALEFELRYRKIQFPYSYSFYGKMKYFFGGNKVMAPEEDAMSFNSGNRYGGGGVFSFLLNDWLAIKNDLSFGYNQFDTYEDKSYQTGEDSWSLYYLPYITFQLKRFRFAEGVGIALLGKSVPADPMYIIMAQYLF